MPLPGGVEAPLGGQSHLYRGATRESSELLGCLAEALTLPRRPDYPLPLALASSVHPKAGPQGCFLAGFPVAGAEGAVTGVGGLSLPFSSGPVRAPQQV